MWDTIFDEIAADYPDVETRRLLVDAAAMFMVKEPERFEVVVASNLHADILTDLGAGIMGGMGLAPSASINPENEFPSTFEPIHGSAPDIAGTNQANPIGMIWSVSMMLEHLDHIGWANAVMSAVQESALGVESRTTDVGGTASTTKAGEAIESLLEDFRPVSDTERKISAFGNS